MGGWTGRRRWRNAADGESSVTDEEGGDGVVEGESCEYRDSWQLVCVQGAKACQVLLS
jgi:hypothetical protein